MEIRETQDNPDVRLFDVITGAGMSGCTPNEEYKNYQDWKVEELYADVRRSHGRTVRVL